MPKKERNRKINLYNQNCWIKGCPKLESIRADEKFKYLGSIIIEGLTCTIEVNAKIAMSNDAVTSNFLKQSKNKVQH